MSTLQISMLYSFVALLGIVFAGWFTLDAHRQLRALRRQGINGQAQLSTAASRRLGSLLTVAFVNKSIIGVELAIVSADRTPDNMIEEWAMRNVPYTLRYGLLLTAAIVLLALVIWRIDFIRLMALIRRDG